MPLALSPPLPPGRWNRRGLCPQDSVWSRRHRPARRWPPERGGLWESPTKLWSIAVNDSFRVRSVQRVRDLNGEVNKGVGLERLPCDPVLERLPFQQLNGNEGLAVVFINVVDSADVRVIERRRRVCFTPESFQGLVVFRHLFG